MHNCHPVRSGRTYSTGEGSFTVLSTSNPPRRHSPLGDVKMDEGRRLPCVLEPEELMNFRAVCRPLQSAIAVAVEGPKSAAVALQEESAVTAITHHNAAETPDLPLISLARLLPLCAYPRRERLHGLCDNVDVATFFALVRAVHEAQDIRVPQRAELPECIAREREEGTTVPVARRGGG